MTDTTRARSAKAHALGLEHGRVTGSWVIDGRTSAQEAAAIVRGYEAGDPAVLDIEPAPLAGTWAGDPTPASLYADLGMSDEDVARDDPSGQLLTDYELAFSDGYWTEVLRAARSAGRPQ